MVLQESRCRMASKIMLRLLIAAPLLLAGCSSWFGYGESGYETVKRRQQEFADLIADAGGSAVKESHEMHGMEADGWVIDLSNVEITEDLIAALTSVDDIQKKPVLSLNLSGSTITDEQLVQLDEAKVLQKVAKLDLSNTAITDAGLDKLKEHYIIMDLKLKGSSVTAAAAKRLGDRQIANPQTPEPFKKQPVTDL